MMLVLTHTYSLVDMTAAVRGRSGRSDDVRCEGQRHRRPHLLHVFEVSCEGW